MRPRDASLDLTVDLAHASSTQKQLADILDEYLTSLEAGVAVDVDEFVSRYPEYESPLREYLESLNLLHGGTDEFHGASLMSGSTRTAKSGAAVLRSLGDYEIIREIGRGGMGIVYEARQLSLDRHVALKVLPFAAVLDPKQVVRFQNEARAAAQLHHPNIVPIHGVGMDRGVHFYAMQFIDGQSLREVLDQLHDTASLDSADQTQRTSTRPAFVTEASSLRTRRPSAYAQSVAQLGIQAADALHHAHECGVIHRDIKPSNLLLDGTGKLWIADFGLARCRTTAGLSQSGDVIGTLHYMSPEQARGESAVSDPRSDVYSLGATLYELLTLCRAFNSDDSPTVLAQIISGEFKPPRALNTSIPTDIENVILKAMALAREDRYRSAAELADDLRRFVNGQPTEARPPTIIKRISQWARRHRRAVLAATVSTSIAICGVTLGGYVASREAANSRKAWEDLRKAKEVVQHVGSRTATLLSHTPGTEIVRQELVSDLLVYHRQFLSLAGDSPQVQRDVAATYAEMAALSDQLGQSDLALANYRQAEELLRESVASDRENGAIVEDLARCRNNIGELLRKSGELDDAQRMFRQAIAAQEQQLGKNPHRTELLLAVATSWNNLGLAQSDTGKAGDALRSYASACKYLESPTMRSRETGDASRTLASVYDNLSQLERTRDLQVALAWNAKALQVLRPLVAPDLSDRIASESALAKTYTNRAALLSEAEKAADAVDAYDAAIKQQQELVRQEPFVARHSQDLAVSLNNRGLAYAKMQEFDKSLESLQESLTLQQELAEDFPADLEIANRLGGVHNNVAMVYQAQGDFSNALKAFEKGIQFLKYAQHGSPQVKRYRDNLSRNYVNYGRLLREMHRPADSVAVARERRRLWPNDPEQLYDVAKEISLASRDLPTGDRHQKEWLAETTAIVAEVKSLGWSPPDESSTNTNSITPATLVGGDR